MNRRFSVALLLLLICAFGHARAQNPSPFGDTKLYDAVLDRLFQHDVQPGVPEIQLRYTSCDVGEMQIVVRRLENSDFRADISRLPPGASNVWHQLAQLTNSNSKLTAAAAVASIRVIRRTVTIQNGTSLAKLLDASSSLSTPLLYPKTITLDGMEYGIAVRSISADLSLTLEGPQHSDDSNNQLIRWMGQVRFGVEAKLKEH
jgi:hypothetical protein